MPQRGPGKAGLTSTAFPASPKTVTGDEIPPDRVETDAEDDDALVRQAREGDRQALETLFDRHFDGVFRLALGFLRDEDRAADAAQDTFVKAMGGLGSFRGEAPFRTWLFSIARNEAMDAARKGGRELSGIHERLEATPTDGPSPLEALEDGRQAEVLRAAVDRLPEKQRMAVSLRVYEGLPYREIAGIIGSSEGAARVNYYHGIQRLKEWLDDA